MLNHSEKLDSLQPFEVSIRRGPQGFGFIVVGHSPVVIQTVDPHSPADSAGIQSGDHLLGIDGDDVSEVDHMHVVQLLKQSLNPRLSLCRPESQPQQPVIPTFHASNDYVVTYVGSVTLEGRGPWESIHCQKAWGVLMSTGLGTATQVLEITANGLTLTPAGTDWTTGDVVHIPADSISLCCCMGAYNHCATIVTEATSRSRVYFLQRVSVDELVDKINEVAPPIVREHHLAQHAVIPLNFLSVKNSSQNIQVTPPAKRYQLPTKQVHRISLLSDRPSTPDSVHSNDDDGFLTADEATENGDDVGELGETRSQASGEYFYDAEDIPSSFPVTPGKKPPIYPSPHTLVKAQELKYEIGRRYSFDVLGQSPVYMKDEDTHNMQIQTPQQLIRALAEESIQQKRASPIREGEDNGTDAQPSQNGTVNKDLHGDGNTIITPEIEENQDVKSLTEDTQTAEEEDDDDDLDFFALLQNQKKKEQAEALSWSPEEEDKNDPENKEGVTGAARWKLRFSNLLADKEDGVKVFMKYLRTISCEENLVFWMDGQKLKEATTDEQIKSECMILYNKFFAPKAPLPLNIDAPERNRIIENINNKLFRKDTFVGAQKQIYRLMKLDSYPKFLNSSMCKDAIKKREKAELKKKKKEEKKLKVLAKEAGSSKTSDSAETENLETSKDKQKERPKEKQKEKRKWLRRKKKILEPVPSSEFRHSNGHESKNGAVISKDGTDSEGILAKQPLTTESDC